MPRMYQVVTQQRPGRPRWALGASVVLLLLTVGLAAALVQHKTGGDTLYLQGFEGPVFKGLQPAGWKTIEQDVPDGTQLALAEPTPGEQPARRLYIFARPVLALPNSTHLAAVAKSYAIDVLKPSVSSSGDLREELLNAGGKDKLMRRPSITVAVEIAPRRGGTTWLCLTRVTALPGVVLGVAVVTPAEKRGVSLRLLDRVSTSLEPSATTPHPAPGDGEESSDIEARFQAVAGRHK